MAQRETLKRSVFVAALACCVLLIAVIWANGIFENDLNQPGYYRNTVPLNESFYLTRTAEYENYALGTPTPGREHEGHGRGGNGQESHTGTPTPTIDWDAREEDQ